MLRTEADRPVIVGLTGTFGSGKSTVARILEECGAGVVDADALARRAVEPGSPVLERIREEFGNAYIQPDGRLDRARMAETVFNAPERRRRLNALIHPWVRREMEKRIAELSRSFRESGWPPMIVLNVPLLFEAGMEGMADCTVVTVVSEKERFRRLRERDGLDERRIKERLGAQWSQSLKARLADVVIDNSGSLEETGRQVREKIAGGLRRAEARSE